MATVNLLKSSRSQTRPGLAFILSYCKRDSKTMHDGRKLVSGVNCVPESAFQEFMNTKMQYGKTDKRMFYHFTQSFHPDEKLTPETAHEIALRFAQQMFPGYEVLVATHTDRDHIHSHFVVNSVSFENRYKYHSDSDNIQRLRQASDKLCLEYGLSVITLKAKADKDKQMSSREYRSAERGESWKLRLAIAIDDAMAVAYSREHFIELMATEGYAVHWTAERKYITYTTPDGQKCRCSKLHEEKYLKGNMEIEFRIRKEIVAGIESQSESGDPNSRAHRPLRYGDRAELVGDDWSAEDTVQNAFRHHGSSDDANDGSLAWQNADTAESDARKVYSGLHGADRGLYGADDAEYDDILETDEYGDERYVITGWEDERAVFAGALFGAGSGEDVPEAQYPAVDDSYRGSYPVGTGLAYLFGHMTNIIDEDAPKKDCTAIYYPSERKHKRGQRMGGM